MTRAFPQQSQTQTEELAARCARAARPGDVFLLGGAIGAGKSTFARAFIRARLNAPHEDVPSPTFTLVQTYEDPEGDIWHCDLYRLGGPADVIELGLDEAFETAICLIEWPDRLGDMAPANAMVIELEAGESGHNIQFSGPADRLTRLLGTND